MSLLDSVTDKEIIVADEQSPESLFEFTETEQTEQEIRSQIQEKFGIQLINPSTFEPDKFHQAYSHVLPEGFTFDPKKVQSIRVRYYDNETSFLVNPYEETEIAPFRFRVSQNHSEHTMIPPELLLTDDLGKMVA